MRRSSLVKHLALTISLLLLTVIFCGPAKAQSGYTTVTAIVQDSNGSLYVNAPYTVGFYDPGTSGKLPTLAGNSPFQKVFSGINTDGSGHLSITLPDNLAIAAASGATGTQWRFTICTPQGQYTTVYCIQYTGTITGSSLDITNALKAVAPILPVSGGGGGLAPGTIGNIVKYGTTVTGADSGIAASNVPLLNGANTFSGLNIFSGKDYSTGGVQTYDVICTGITATDSAALNTAISHANTLNNQAGGAVVLHGETSSCAIDGSLVTIPSNTQIGINGIVNMQNGHGFQVGQTDLVSKVHFFGIRSAGATPAFGNQNQARIAGATGGFGSPLIDVAGIEGDFLIDGLYLEEDSSHPVLRIHAFDKVTAGCPSPPCGSTQVTIRHTAVTNFTGIAVSLDDSGLVIRGAWSSGTTYNYDDEVTVAGVRYISMLGANTNHAPAGGAPWWTPPIGIAGFDASIEGLVTSTASTSTPGFYNQDFGNVQFGGPVQSWMNNGGIVQVCSTGFQCGNNTYDLISSESLGTDFIQSTGLFVNVLVSRLFPSDSSTYTFKNTLGSNGQGAQVYFHGNFYQTSLLDPASDPLTLLPGSDYDSSLIGSIANPKTTALPNLVGYGLDASGRRNGTATTTRFQNQSAFYLAPAGSYTGFSIANVADPLGGSVAGRVTTSITSDGPLFANHIADTPIVGDVLVGLIAIRTLETASFNLSISLDWDGSGSTLMSKGYGFPTPFPAGGTIDHAWKYYVTLKEVTATDGMSHPITFIAANTSDTTHTWDFALPYWVKIPASAGLSDAEILNWAMSLIPTPPTSACVAGSLCSPLGPIARLDITQDWTGTQRFNTPIVSNPSGSPGSLTDTDHCSSMGSGVSDFSFIPFGAIDSVSGGNTTRHQNICYDPAGNTHVGGAGNGILGINQAYLADIYTAGLGIIPPRNAYTGRGFNFDLIHPTAGPFTNGSMGISLFSDIAGSPCTGGTLECSITITPTSGAPTFSFGLQTLNAGVPSITNDKSAILNFAIGNFGSYMSGPVYRILESTAPSGISSTDLIYGLSAIHWPAFNANNVGERRLCGSTGTMTSGHIVAINTTGTICDLVDGGTGTGSGSVTNFSSGPLATGSQNFFTTSVATSGTTPAQTFALVNSPPHKYFGNPNGSTAAPDYSSIVEADLPAATMFTDQNFAYGAHNADFSGATILKLRVGAGLTSSANGDLGYDSTNKNWHAWTNGADLLMVPLASGFVSGHCGQPTSTAGAWLIADTGNPCGTGTGPTLQTNAVNNTNQTTLNLRNTTGGGAASISFTNPSTSNVEAALTNTVGGGNAALACTETGGTQGDYFGLNSGPTCVNITPGVTPNLQTGATYTVDCTPGTGDRGKILVFNRATAIAVTVPQSGSGFCGNNFYFNFKNIGAGAVTFTPTISTVNPTSGAGTGAATLIALNNQQGAFTGNNTDYFVTLSGEAVATSGSISGAIIGIGCDTGTVTINGAATSMVPRVSPNTYPGDGLTWSAQVTAANTVTVRVCSDVTVTPTASTYNVRLSNP